MDSQSKQSRSGRGYRRKSKGAGLTRPQKLNRIFSSVAAIVGVALLLLVAFVAGRNSTKSDDHQLVAGLPGEFFAALVQDPVFAPHVHAPELADLLQ